MKRVIFDIETNGLLDNATKIHCLCLIDIDTKEERAYSTLDGTLEEGLRTLNQADFIVGVNSVSFDVPAIDKLAKLGLGARESIQEHLDIQLFARLKFPDTTDRDFRAMNSGFPRELIGKHSLKAWGYRIGVIKGNYGETSNWETCTQEMIDYCMQDCRVTLALYNYLKPWEYSQEAIQLEHDVRRFMNIQETQGTPFNTQEARALYKKVKAEYDAKWGEVKNLFPNKVETSVFVPKTNNKTRGYVKGQPVTKTLETEFNPGSRDQLIDFFKTKYNWEPVSFTPKGKPEIGFDVLSKMPYEEAKVIAELFDMKKLMGTLFDGDNGWLKLVKDNKIHGGIITNGAVSGRAAHFKPNLGNVPNVHSYMGKECRQLFASLDPDYVFVGGDAKAIQVRMLAHYLYFWDEGEYAHEAVNGDIHTKNMNAFGITSRDTAKTVFFAMVFGSGAANLGRVVDPTCSTIKAESIGNEIINNFKRNIPAYAHLHKTVKNKLYNQGFVVGLDGRRLIPRSKHAGLCTMIQGGEAVVMKRALSSIHKAIKANNYDARPVLWVHDELELVAHKDHADVTAQLIPYSIREAGDYFKLKCPMDGTGKIGNNWYEVH